MVAFVKQLIGEVHHLRGLELNPEDHWEEAREKVRKAFLDLDQGEGVLLFTDVTGGTPFNVSESLSSEHTLEVIGGMNIPMVLKATQVSTNMNLQEAATYLETYGREHITKGKSTRHAGIR